MPKLRRRLAVFPPRRGDEARVRFEARRLRYRGKTQLRITHQCERVAGPGTQYVLPDGTAKFSAENMIQIERTGRGICSDRRDGERVRQVR